MSPWPVGGSWPSPVPETRRPNFSNLSDPHIPTDYPSEACGFAKGSPRQCLSRVRGCATSKLPGLLFVSGASSARPHTMSAASGS